MTEDFEKLLIKLAKILERLKIGYFITGGYAVSVWGRPRSTFDIDVVVQLSISDVTRLAGELRKLSKAGYIDEVTAEKAIGQGGEFNFIHPESGVKIDFWVAKSGLVNQQLKRRKVKLVGSNKIYFISPEDLILNKLLWYRESESSRQLEDVESILKISGQKLDKRYLNNWAKKLGVSAVLNDLYKKCHGKQFGD